MISAITLGLRALQLLFSVVILGLAVTLIKGQVIDDAPVTTKYASFTGGFGIIVCALGVASLWVSAIPDLVVLGIDALAGIFFAAGGIAWAIGLRGIQCTNEEQFDKLLDNGLLNQGSVTVNGGTAYGVYKDDTSGEAAWKKLSSNCQKGLADEVFQFLTFGLAVGLLALGYVRMKNGGGTKRSGYVV
ncbi:marvel domain-containing protein [Apodospora peruviana]|uniref:Marvel domain-containing protein n=1 Tax=Apodospora peruviana TaxID=516989 RepID=A0AAE0M606_9PEZI|nr:marvel domain-containing protein [Apodospora peruviana]